MKVSSLVAHIAIALFAVQTPHTWSHAEHDKPRYVAENGVDQGNCERIKTPCKTIDYAARQANKGDRILVAGGSYAVMNADTLFHLLSDVIPVQGGYAPHSFKRAPDRHPTRLVGVPPEYADELAARGFQVIVDQKGLSKDSNQELSGKLALANEMTLGQSKLPCTQGTSSSFPCHQVDLVAHMPLADLGGSVGNDVWGHTDLNTGREYALMGLNNGVAIVDLNTPASPRLVSHIPGQDTTWRDIKVLQTYSAELRQWRAWAYVTADDASVGLQILDLNQLPERVTLAATKQIHTALTTSI